VTFVSSSLVNTSFVIFFNSLFKNILVVSLNVASLYEDEDNSFKISTLSVSLFSNNPLFEFLFTFVFINLSNILLLGIPLTVIPFSFILIPEPAPDLFIISQITLKKLL